MNESRLVGFDEAGKPAGRTHPNTLSVRKGGTENLTHASGLSNPRKVEPLVKLKITQTLAAEHDRGKMLRLAS